MRTSAIPAALLALALAACAGDATAPPTLDGPLAARAGAGRTAERATAAERWSAVARGIVSRRETGPLGIARSFALVSVAQYDAVIAAESHRGRGPRPSPSAAAAGAAATVLRAIYPAEAPAIAAQLAADAAYFPAQRATRRADHAAGLAVGEAVAAVVLARAASDGSTARFTGTLPTGPGFWFSAPAPAVPIGVLWGTVRPWLMESGSQVRPAAPPAFGSPAFAAALAEVRQFSDERTPAQLASAQFWVTGPGTAGPLGYWTEVGFSLAAQRRYDERRATRLLAVLHMAGMDASIGCWDAKYAYSLVRPYQVDPAITTPVGRPNFPAYPSAHSCFSAAAAEVLVGFFPAAAPELRARVAEAGVSRIYAGLHYRFDVDAGQQIGRDVAALALANAPRGQERIVVE